MKLQKKVKEVIENHSALQWFGNRRNTRQGRVESESDESGEENYSMGEDEN
jgi:hypothetical protein